MEWKKRKPNGYKKSLIYTQSHDIWLKKYEKLLNTAISSWSGYVYQGKVALYHVLKNINNNMFTLQLDSLDDFAILDEQNNVISLHQVKAKKENRFSSYEKAFRQLNYGGEVIGCDKLYFHLTQRISDKTIEDIENEFNPIIVYPYNINKFCEVDQIDNKIEEEITNLMRIEYFSDDPSKFENEYAIKVRIYLDNIIIKNYLRFIKLYMMEICLKLTNLMRIEYFSDDPSKFENEYAIKVRIYLDNIIIKKLFEIHKIIHDGDLPETIAAYDRRIEFSKFIEILSEDLNQKNLGNEYYLYKIKSDICRYYQEYCYENELSINTLIRMNDFISFFRELEENNLIKFIKNIIPHRTFIFESLSDYKDNSPQQNEIKYVFLYIIHQIEKNPSYVNNCLLQWKSDNKLFSPTCINDNSRNADRVCNQIIKNALSTDLDVLFKNQNLITDSISLESMTASHIIRNNYQDADKEYKHIMKWGKVSLVNIDDIKGEFND